MHIKVRVDAKNHFVLFHVCLRCSGRIANPTRRTGPSRCSTKLLSGHKRWARRYSGNAGVRSTGRRQGSSANPSRGQVGPTFEAHFRLSIPAVALVAHGLEHAKIVDQSAMLIIGVLAAAVRVHDQPWRWIALPIRGCERLTDQVGFHALAHRLADDTATGQAHHAGQIQPVFDGGNVGDVIPPGLIDPPALEAPIQHVERHRLAVI